MPTKKVVNPRDFWNIEIARNQGVTRVCSMKRAPLELVRNLLLTIPHGDIRMISFARGWYYLDFQAVSPPFLVALKQSMRIAHQRYYANAVGGQKKRSQDETMLPHELFLETFRAIWAIAEVQHCGIRKFLHEIIYERNPRRRGDQFGVAEGLVIAVFAVLVLSALTTSLTPNRSHVAPNVSTIRQITTAPDFQSPGTYRTEEPPAYLMGGNASVTFLNVGQGDATLIKFSNGSTMLVDAGRYNDLADRLLKMGISKIDVLVLTHPDADHIGGAPNILRRIPVGAVFDPGVAHPSALYEEALRSIGLSTRYIIPTEGQNISPDPSVTVQVLACNSISNNSNNASIVLRVQGATGSVLLAADAERELEAYLVSRYGTTLRSDILKVAHHGSKTSSTPSFISRVSPRTAVLSYGAGNSYGHPHSSVIETLRNHGATMLHTVNGDITLNL